MGALDLSPGARRPLLPGRWAGRILLGVSEGNVEIMRAAIDIWNSSYVGHEGLRQGRIAYARFHSDQAEALKAG